MTIDSEISDAIPRLDPGLKQSSGEEADSLPELFVTESALPADNGCSASVLALRMA